MRGSIRENHSQFENRIMAGRYVGPEHYTLYYVPKTHPGNLEFLNGTGPDPLKNPKTTKPEFNVGPFK